MGDNTVVTTRFYIKNDVNLVVNIGVNIHIMINIKIAAHIRLFNIFC